VYCAAFNRNGENILSYEESQERQTVGRPNMCRSCGAIVAAGETNCGQCGAPVKEQASAAPVSYHRAPDQATLRFAQDLFRRPVTFTMLFLVANVLLFILTSLAGGAQNTQTLINFGAKLNTLINEQGEWWRFVAPIFLHGGVLHLLMNMYGLWILGPTSSGSTGRRSSSFSGLYGHRWRRRQLSQRATGVTCARRIPRALLFKAGDAVSVGASGALFGLIGVLFVFGVKYRGELLKDSNAPSGQGCCRRFSSTSSSATPSP
jgi:membrane associated rhomboid family serine protease